MKGYEMIVLVNGLVLFAVGLLTIGNGILVERKGTECASGNATQCQRDLLIGQTTRTVSPFLFAGGALLLGIGVSLVLYRRWFKPPEPPSDEGPPYP